MRAFACYFLTDKQESTQKSESTYIFSPNFYMDICTREHTLFQDYYF